MDVLNSLGLEGPIQNYSLEEICAAIETLQKAKAAAKRQEKAERERREREERERKEAHIREVTCMDLPLDWNNAFQSDIRTRGVHVEGVSDGLVWSLNTLGRVDIEYIAAVTGADYKTVICTLKGSTYQNPETWGECFYQGWETAEEYLSGNLMRKWRAAKEADRAYQGYFSDNVRAIERVLPPAVPAEDIYVTLGSPWVPADVIDDFILSLFGEPAVCLWEGEFNREKTMEFYQTRHDEITGTWEIPDKSRYRRNVGVTQTYGTERMGALHILEKTLNMKTVAVTDEIGCPTNASGKKRVVNQGETVAALEKQQKLIQAFQAWVWTDKTRRKRLETIFEDNYGCVRRRIFDGSFLPFPTLSPSIRLYPYQKDAVARIIFSPNTLLAHDVGSGKTYVMIAAGQELRRMGLSKKNMYVVPNNILGQWRDIFLTMYPDARLLCVGPNAFTPGKREKVLETIQSEDFDGIIIAYSCFEQIPLSKDYYIEELEGRKETIAKLAAQKGKATSRLERRQNALEKALSDLSAAMDEMYTVLQRRLVDAKLRMEQELMELPAKMRAQRDAVRKCEGDLARVLPRKPSCPEENGGQGRREQAAERKALRERIRRGLEDNVWKTRETPLMEYRGFDVILPANMTLEKPYVWLSGQGRYYVELGNTEVGSLVRIDHFLDSMAEYLQTLKLGCSKLEKREAELKAELAKGETYMDEMERYRKKVELLDKKLGVNQG